MTATRPSPWGSYPIPAFARYVGSGVEPIPPHLHLEIIAFLLRAEAGDPKLHQAGVRLLARVRAEVSDQSEFGDYRTVASQALAVFPNIEVDPDAIVSRATQNYPAGVWVQCWHFLAIKDMKKHQSKRKCTPDNEPT